MRPLAGFLLGCTLAALSPTARAAELTLLGEDEALTAPFPPDLSAELLDPSGRTSFHLVTRSTASRGPDTFSKSTTWSFEAIAAVRISEGIALTALLPFGLDAPSPGANQVFIGNIRVGIAGGGVIRLDPETNSATTPKLTLGGALDVYVPTTPRYQPSDCGLGFLFCDPTFQVRGIRAYEPQLYVSDLMAFRVRGQAGFTMGLVSAAFELGLTPAFTLESSSRFLMLFGWALRLSAKPTYYVEPFAEVGSAIHIVGASALTGIDEISFDLTTPVILTLGVRAHIDSIDPAVFISLDLDQGAVIFGLDLAGAIRDVSRSSEVRDFLDF